MVQGESRNQNNLLEVGRLRRRDDGAKQGWVLASSGGAINTSADAPRARHPLPI
jgi:hypothetical protein